MLDFSDCKIMPSEASVVFKSLQVGETFVMANNLDCGSIDLNRCYIYIKTSGDYALELNEEDFHCSGQSFAGSEQKAVIRVKLTVSSVTLIH